MYGCMDLWIYGSMCGWIYGWVDGCMNGRTDVNVHLSIEIIHQKFVLEDCLTLSFVSFWLTHTFKRSYSMRTSEPWSRASGNGFKGS